MCEGVTMVINVYKDVTGSLPKVRGPVVGNHPVLTDSQTEGKSHFLVVCPGGIRSTRDVVELKSSILPPTEFY